MNLRTEPGRPTHPASSNGLAGRCAFVSILALALGAWAAAPGGIIELGKKGQRSTGSDYVVFVNGDPFRPAHAPGELAETILERARLLIDADPRYSATPVAGPDNAIEILLENGDEPSFLEVFVQDTGIQGAAVRHPDAANPTLPIMRYHGVGKTGAGDVTLTVDTLPASKKGNPAFIDTVTVNVATTGKSPAQVNEEIKAALESAPNDFNVTASANDSFIATRPGHFILSVKWETTDNAVDVSGVALPPGPPGSVPALGEWGLAALILLLTGAAILLIRRRRDARPAA